MLRRSQLYVPGNNERMVRNASTLPSDSVIIDLEDAVPPRMKAGARKRSIKLANELKWKGEVCVRINPPESVWGRSDLIALNSAVGVRTIVVPKAEGDLSALHKKTGKALIPIIETAKGLQKLEVVVRSDGVEALSYGAADLALSMGGSVDAYLTNSFVKTSILLAARAAGIEAIDNVFFDLRDSKGFKRQALEARALGFTGKQVIHPSQVEMANAIFSPTPAELKWANAVMRTYERAKKNGRGALSFKGQLVDEVHYELARRLAANSA